MTKTELLMASSLLSMAAESYSNHGCNDLDLRDYIADQSLREDFVRRMTEWNGDPDQDPDEAAKRPYTADFAVMSYLAALLRAEAESK